MGPDADNPLATLTTYSRSPTPPLPPDLEITKIDLINPNITRLQEPLNDVNWVLWCERMRCIFVLCQVDPYVYGTLKKPKPTTSNSNTIAVWNANDVYAQILITNNITQSQLVHVSRFNTSHEIWKSLEAIHETKDYQVAVAIQ